MIVSIFEPGEFVHIVDDNRASYCAIISAATDDGYSVTTATSKATPVPASAVRPGWPAKIDPRVLAVRTDDIVGRYTCSVIDECWTDAELQDEFDSDGVPRSFSKQTARRAVSKCRFIHRAWAANAEEIIATADW